MAVTETVYFQQSRKIGCGKQERDNEQVERKVDESVA